MKPYRDYNNDSNIEAYEYGDDYIVVEFKKGKFTCYKYTYLSAGRQNVEEMKRLADCGDGLNSFISTEKPDYSNKY